MSDKIISTGVRFIFLYFLYFLFLQVFKKLHNLLYWSLIEFLLINMYLWFKCSLFFIIEKNKVKIDARKSVLWYDNYNSFIDYFVVKLSKIFQHIFKKVILVHIYFYRTYEMKLFQIKKKTFTICNTLARISLWTILRLNYTIFTHLSFLNTLKF